MERRGAESDSLALPAGGAAREHHRQLGALLQPARLKQRHPGRPTRSVAGLSNQHKFCGRSALLGGCALQWMPGGQLIHGCSAGQLQLSSTPGLSTPLARLPNLRNGTQPSRQVEHMAHLSSWGCAAAAATPTQMSTRGSRLTCGCGDALQHLALQRPLPAAQQRAVLDQLDAVVVILSACAGGKSGTSESDAGR